MPSFTPRSILADIDMDEELLEKINKYKETDMSPDELHLKIQGDRVIYILNRCLAKLNTLAHLPHLLQNDAELIRKFLKPSEAFFVLEVFCEWGLLFDTRNIRNTEYIGDYLRLGTVNKSSRKQQASTSLPEGFPNPQIYQLVDILFYNKCMQNAIRTAEHVKLDKHVMGMIKYIQELKEIAKNKVYITGEQEKANERELRRMYKSNISLSAVIKALKEQLEKQRKELGRQLKNKVQIFESYDNKMETVTENFQMDIRKTLRESEKEMMQKCLESEEKQANLADKAYETVQKYENILKANLNEEKKARSKRLKIETQLQNWVNTFDQDIGEKQVQYDELMEEYNETKAKKQHIEKLVAEQEPDYLRSMQEKSDEEERIFNEMAFQFYLDRCARKIQRYWRLYLEKKALLKGRKKGKKKK